MILFTEKTYGIDINTHIIYVMAQYPSIHTAERPRYQIQQMIEKVVTHISISCPAQSGHV